MSIIQSRLNEARTWLSLQFQSNKAPISPIDQTSSDTPDSIDGVDAKRLLSRIFVNKFLDNLSRKELDGWYNRDMNFGDSTQHKISQKISLVTADEEQIWQEDIDLTRRMPKEKIVPEDWSILDIFLPPSRESAPAPDQST